jgi:hypothetical protein
MNKQEIIFWIFGLTYEETNIEALELKDEKENDITINIDISETSKQKLFCNIMAIILMSCTGFLWAFFNRFE